MRFSRVSPLAIPQELVQLTWQHGTEIGTTFNWPDYEPLLAPQPALPGLFAYLIQEMNLRSGNVSERVRAHLVSGSYYSTLGVKAFLGRTLAAGDDRPEAAPAAVLSYTYWGRRFGFDPAVIGRAGLPRRHAVHRGGRGAAGVLRFEPTDAAGHHLPSPCHSTTR